MRLCTSRWTIMEPKKTDNPELWCCTRTKFWKAPNPMCQSLRLSEKFACARIRSCPKFCPWALASIRGCPKYPQSCTALYCTTVVLGRVKTHFSFIALVSMYMLSKCHVAFCTPRRTKIDSKKKKTTVVLSVQRSVQNPELSETECAYCNTASPSRLSAVEVYCAVRYPSKLPFCMPLYFESWTKGILVKF